MTLSRTARILIAVLLLAAAAFFWVNFFSQEQPSSAPIAASAPPPSPAKPAAASPSGNASATSAPAAAEATTPAAPTDAKPSSSSASGTVVAPTKPAVATRDLQVAELPFLVTEPPTSTSSSSGAASSGGTSGGTPQQTASAQRMTVNPFSPIVVKAAAAPKPQAPAQPPAPQTVKTAAAPASTPTPAKLADAPTPQPVAPPPPQASGLPRALPSGMLPTTPGVLQTTRAQATSSAPKDLGTVAAVREPSDGSTQDGNLASIGQSGLVASSPSVPGVLGPSQATQASAGNPGNVGNGNAPLQAGTDSLSRYLRDNDVRFTGTVLGPVSVGVFRSDQYKTPVVVSLGQDLPDTQITLTDLRGHEALFTWNDSTQSLSLDLRR